MFGDRPDNRVSVLNYCSEKRVGSFYGLLYTAARGDSLLLHGLRSAANKRQNEFLIADKVENSDTVSDVRLRNSTKSGLGPLEQSVTLTPLC